MSTATNSQAIATVVSVTGVAFARNADGGVRRLATGDTIYVGEIVFTMADGQVELSFADGHHATILPSESYLMGPEAMIATSPTPADAAIAAAGEVGKVIAAVEGQGDILEGLEAPAAGGAGAENSGNSFVRLLRIVEPITPVEYEYPVNPFGDIRAPEGTVVEENGVPTAGETSAFVDDDGLPAGNPVSMDGDLDANIGEIPPSASEAIFNGILPHDFGTDGPGGISFASMHNMTAVIGQEEVTFSWSGNTLTATITSTPDSGRSGDVLFTVTVNPLSGAYTLTLETNVLHLTLDGADGDDTENDAFATLTYTVTDDNGDDEFGLLYVTFDDDGPTASIDEGEDSSLTVDETNDSDDDASAPLGYALGTATANLVSVGALNPTGADGDGATIQFSLSIASDGTDSGLDTTDGTDILLYQFSDTEVRGIVDGTSNVAFTITIDNDGDVTVTQYLSLFHYAEDPAPGEQNDPTSHDEPMQLDEGTVMAVLTVTDGDGDVDTDAADITGMISFEDDGPTADITRTTNSITLDESLGVDAGDPNAHLDDNVAGNPFNVAWGTPIGLVSDVDLVNTTTATGEDDEGATTAVTLEIVGGEGADSGLKTTDGTTITLWQEADGTVTGRTGGENGTVIFAISINSDGEVTVAQYDSLFHYAEDPAPGDQNDPTSHDESVNLAGKLNAVVTVTDGDDDVATDYIAIGNAISFEDDGPSNASLSLSGSLIHDETPGDDGDDDVTDDLFGLFSGVTDKGIDDDMPVGYARDNLVSSATVSYGSDGQGAAPIYSLTLSEDGVDSGLDTTEGFDILLTIENGLIVGRVDANDNGEIDAGEDAAFALYVNSSTGELTMAQYLSIKHDDRGDFDESNDNGTNTNDAAPDDTPDPIQQTLASGAAFLTATFTDGDGDTTSASTDLNGFVLFEDDGPNAENEPTVVLAESHVETIDVLTGTKSVANNAGDTGQGAGYVYITTVDLVSGDSLKIDWDVNGSVDIYWKLVPTGGGTTISGSSLGDNDDTLLLNLLATGEYELWIDASKSLTVLDVTQERTITSTDSGNVILGDPGADTVGADGAKVYSIDYLDANGDPATEILGADGFADVETEYGFLHIEADGTYEYTVKQNAVDSAGATDTITYTLMDGDGDSDTATMAFQITDIAQANILNGVMKTNSNVTNQFVTLSFIEVDNPLHAAAKIYDLYQQGQQGSIVQDVGFNIDDTKDHQVTLEASAGTKAIVTDFSLEGVLIQGSGNAQLEKNNVSSTSSDSTAITAVINPNDPIVEAKEQSVDGDENVNALNSPATGAPGNTLSYVFGADGDDILNGGAGSDVLNGGGGHDELYGNGGNDVLVFDNDNNDLIRGGEGFDILRVDDGALELSMLGSADPSNTLSLSDNPIIDLRGKDIQGIEAILITEEAGASTTGLDPNDDVGTTIQLNVQDVLDYTDNIENALYILGSPGDTVQLVGGDWDDGELQAADSQGQYFTLYTSTTDGAKLYVENGVLIDWV